MGQTRHILVAGGFHAGSQYAHAINTVKMAQGFARLGYAVSLVCRQPPGGSANPRQLAQVYGLNTPLRWVQLPLRLLGRPTGEHRLFGLAALAHALALGPRLVYARSYVLPWLSSRLGLVTAAESHAGPDGAAPEFRWLLAAARQRALKLWVTISPRLADHYRTLGVPQSKLAVLPDAVDLDLFERPGVLPPSPYQGRGPHVVYAGHLYDYKGIPTVLEAAARLPEVQFHLVGGWPGDVARHERAADRLGLTNLSFHGLQPQAALPPFLWHADLLLLPPSQHHPSAAWTSPLKLGEYLASGVPVVASAIPALQTWVTSDEVAWVAPDDPSALAEEICRLLPNTRRVDQLRAAGWQLAQRLSYERRASAIVERI